MAYTVEMQSKTVNFCSQVWAFVRLTRAQFLLGGLLLYALGAAVAAHAGVAINWRAYWLGQVMVTTIQLMAQYLNEYYDMEVDGLAENNRTWLSGGSGILSSGDVPPVSVLTAARICAVVAILSGILASAISQWMAPIVLLSFAGAWFYSVPPVSLMSSGWGELTTSAIVALLVPLAGYCMQAGFPPAELWLICVPLLLVHTAMLISFEIPDRAADLSAGKRTLTVRLGLRGAAWLENALIALAYLFLVILLLFSKYTVQWMEWTFPLAVWQMVMIHRAILSPTRMHYSLLTTGGIGLFALMAALAFVELIF